MSYIPPLRDLAFSLFEVAGARALQPHFEQFDEDTAASILEASGELARDVLAPLNRIGDQTGAKFENGKVVPVPGFAAAYKAFAEGGWNSLAAAPEFGGQGLPKALEVCVYEMVQSANMSFALCPMLTQGAIEALSVHGTDRQKQLYMPNLVSGQWTGTMNLTEPQAGSDLAGLRTRAEPDGDGYRIFGQKIFITWGDHDMTPNTVHLVLARLPDAPEGTRGISLFLAPKYLVNENGSLGAANALKPASIEHKLGIHASPTCVMLYEGAKAELIGAPNQGLACMFTMMNNARLHVGVQGVGIANRAYQQALAYAQERRQGRSAWTGDQSAPLFDHPDIRRILMLMKAKVEAARAICLSTAVAADMARVGDAEQREHHKLREELLTPIAKAWSTDVGVEVASMGVQIHGGMGYMEETGAAQYYRDARIAPIYEGTNAIQAIDLMGRKLAMNKGKAVDELLHDVTKTVEALAASPNEFHHIIGIRLNEAVAAAREASAWLIERRGHAAPDALAGSTAYLQLLGDVTAGWLLAKAALASKDRMRTGIARIFANSVLATAPGLAAGVMQGSSDLYNITAEALAP
ncbi:MAG: acyl-CoA dehydrogenase [Alphaproteobacteria bacterium]|nr:acyl-CoA dehydrogenase [Alphaproteobacteria bacterium]